MKINRISQIIDVLTLTSVEIQAIISDLVFIRALPSGILIHHSVMDFCGNNLILKLGSIINFDVLYNSYTDYCLSHDISPLKKPNFPLIFVVILMLILILLVL